MPAIIVGNIALDLSNRSVELVVRTRRVGGGGEDRDGDEKKDRDEILRYLPSKPMPQPPYVLTSRCCRGAVAQSLSPTPRVGLESSLIPNSLNV